MERMDYTDLSDARWSIGPHFILLRPEAGREAPQKLGVLNKQGWCAYEWGESLFVKRFGYREGGAYPDYGCNNEVFTKAISWKWSRSGRWRHWRPVSPPSTSNSGNFFRARRSAAAVP